MAVKGKGSINDNDVFIFPKEKELETGDLKGFIDYHTSKLLPIYKENINLYKSKHNILSREKKPLNKPDHRLVVNYPKYIVEEFNGFFIGIPPQITLPDEKENGNLQLFNQRNRLADKLSELSKQSSIYGRSHLFVYQNELAKTCIAISSPTNSFMIYDDTVASEPYGFVRYSVDEDNKMSGNLYLSDSVKTFDNDCKFTDEQGNIYQNVPAVEFIENEERLSVFDSVKTLVESLNNVISQKANDVDAIADAYLKIFGFELDEDTLKELSDNRVIASESKEGDAAFLERPNGDGTQENLIDRLISFIFQISMVANITDENFGGNASGVSLEFKILPMKNLASNKERKYTDGLRSLYKIVFNVDALTKSNVFTKTVDAVKSALGLNETSEPVDELVFQFTRNLPKNISDEATTAKNLEGVVSKETQLKVLSIVTDPQAEIKQMESEKQDTIKNSIDSIPGDYDFEKPTTTNDKKVGESDGAE